MSHIPYYGEEPMKDLEPRPAPSPPTSGGARRAPASDELRFWADYRGIF